jgi:hypothetical protein
LLCAASLILSRKEREKKDRKPCGAKRRGKMGRSEIEKLRERVSCQAVLEVAGFAIDAKESTASAVKYRRDGEIIIVTYKGRGWFNPLGEEKGDVFSLLIHLERCDFLEACERAAALSSLPISGPACYKQQPDPLDHALITEKWARRRPPWPGSATWKYLAERRRIPAFIIGAAVARDLLREGPYGSMWAAHSDDLGGVSGWEGRGPEWRGFAKGGRKILFRFGEEHGTRLCVTEAAIDAMSLAAMEGMRDDSLYLSTGGGWAPATAAALRRLATRAGARIVAATDGNHQGDIYADRLRALAEGVGCGWLRHRPPTEDWNEALEHQKKKGSE